MNHVTIAGNTITRNGTAVFHAPGPLSDFLTLAYQHFDLQYPKFYKMDTLSKLGWLGAEILLRELALDHYAPESIGIVLSNANASLDTDIRYWDTVKEMPSPAVFVYTLPNIVAGEIAIRHKWKGENAFFISPEFDPELTNWYVDDLLNNGRVEACLFGWVDMDRVELFFVEKASR